MKNSKKLSLFLAFCIFVSVFSVFTAFATEEGTCGENLLWELEYVEDGWVLTISGTGDMYDFEQFTYTPWKSYRENIRKIIIENEVTSIGNKAFSNMTKLKNVDFGKSLKRIGEYAFKECVALENVIIPDSVESLEKRAFQFCEGLKTLIIGNSVKELGEGAFAFCESLTDVEIGDSVSTIDSGAFSSCYSLKNISFGKSVESIGYSAFIACRALEEVTLPVSLKLLGSEAFSNCASLKEIVFYDSLENIGASTFNACFALEDVQLPKSLTHVGNTAFYDCPLIKSIEIPKSVEVIGEKAFGFYYDYEIDKRVKVESFTIYGEKETAAERYATSNVFCFVDVNENVEDSYSVYIDADTNTINGVVEKTTTEALINKLSNLGITANVSDENGEAISAESLVGTGFIVSDESGNNYSIVVLGDVDGTGIVDSTDYLKIKSMFIGEIKLQGAYEASADVDKDGEINSTDYLRIKNYFLGNGNLYE